MGKCTIRHLFQYLGLRCRLFQLWSVNRGSEVLKDQDILDARCFLDDASHVINPKFLEGFLSLFSEWGKRKCSYEALVLN